MAAETLLPSPRGRRPSRFPRAVLSAILFLVAGLALGFEPFVIRDIRVEGLQRTDAGTIFNYLPVKVGDRLDEDKAAQALKALYATGFFRDVRLEGQEGVLIVTVLERPTISKIDITGSKEFDKETLTKALRDIGLAEARIFDRAALERAEQELKRQYISRGRYAAKVTTTATPLERNRVAIDFAIEEGEVAKIARINIVGNKTFTEKQLLSEMTLTTPGWLTWYTKNDQYSKQKLASDLEAVRSYYTNRGYLDFTIDSTQVSITPDKEEIFITVNVSEGQRYTVSDVRIAGDLLVPESELRPLVLVRPGDVFSRERLTQSAKLISDRLGEEGYAFANVNAVPELDREKQQVAFTFFIDPGRRVYVRRINISGNTRTRDEVIRREIRQLESAWYDTAKIQRSKQRIDRLGFFSEVNIETPAVVGSSDQVDIEVAVQERQTGNISIGAGFSSGEGLVLSGSVSQQNIFGSGNALTAQINTGNVNRVYSLSYTNPYWTPDGVARGFDLYNRRLDSSTLSVGRYRSDTSGAGIRFGVPVSESDYINLGFAYEHTKITLYEDSPPRYIAYVAQFGEVTDSVVTSLQWSRDTRDSVIWPTRGSYQRAFGEFGFPGTDLTYYKVNYQHQWLRPLPLDLVILLNGEVGYGDGYSGKPLPFFKSFYAGGVGSVRGYETASLGPRDVNGDALGGKRRIVANAEILFPIPGMKGDKSVRGSVFADAGQLYLDGRQPDFESFRYSVGLGVAWQSPLGPLKFNYAMPLGNKDGDRLQRFQFQVGTTF